jgi:predicted DNA-binding ribbon-helix-helix protein
MPRVSENQSATGYLQSNVAKRSLLVGGHRTSVSLEDVFWNGLRAIAKERRVHLSELVAIIDDTREHANLSSAIRLFVFEHRTDQQIAHSNLSAR